MPTATAAKQTDGKKADAKADAAGKRSRKKLLIIVAAAALALAGVGGYLMLGSSKSTTAAVKPGAVVKLDADTVNLAGGHYLKITVAVQETSTAPSSLDMSMAHELILDEFCNQSIADLLTTGGRDAAKADLEKRLAKQYPDDIMGLYLVGFVMQ